MGQAERIFFRLQTGFPLRLKPPTKEELVRGRALDLSTSGMGFECDENLPKGSVVPLEFRLPGTFKKIKVEGEVMRQSEGRKYDFVTGVRFTKIDAASVDHIAAFIRKRSSFLLARFFILLLGVLVFGATALRMLNFIMIDYYGATEFGKEWVINFWPDYALASYITLHVLFGFWYIVSSVGIFFFRRWARRLIILLSFIGVIAQAVRAIAKFQFVAGDTVFKAIFAAECLIAVPFFLILFTLSRRNFRERFDAVLTTLKQHLEYEREERKG